MSSTSDIGVPSCPLISLHFRLLVPFIIVDFIEFFLNCQINESFLQRTLFGPLHCFPLSKSGSIRTPPFVSSLMPQVANIPLFHLVPKVGTWTASVVIFLSRSESLYGVIVNGAPDDVIHEDLGNQDFNPPPLLPIDNVSLVPNGKGEKSAIPSSTHMITCFATKHQCHWEAPRFCFNYSFHCFVTNYFPCSC